MYMWLPIITQIITILIHTLDLEWCRQVDAAESARVQVEAH